MIKTYKNTLDENLIKKIFNYLKNIFGKEVWSSSISWNQNLSLISSNILTHTIYDKFLIKSIKKNIEDNIKIDFDEKNLDFMVSIYVWCGGSYITWHDDSCYPYNGTIYLNEEWDSDDGGVFLYKDNQTKEIRGVNPIYNSMVVNSASETDPHNDHCVTCIVPGTIKKRITLQWRTSPKKKNALSYQ
jgi:Rps23 Pro-64 3,4-dihydroxylase Tpa1-like proline 4-hydroxylase